MILKHLLVHSAPITNMRERYAYRRFGRLLQHDLMLAQNSSKVVDTSIMQTCRQLHAEAAQVLYRRNTFIIEDSELLQVQLPGSSNIIRNAPALHPAYAPLVRFAHGDLRSIDHAYNFASAVVYMLKKWPNVRNLIVAICPSTFKKLGSMLQEMESRSEVSEHMGRTRDEIWTLFSMADSKVPQDLDVLILADLESHESIDVLEAINSAFTSALHNAKSIKRRNRF